MKNPEITRRRFLQGTSLGTVALAALLADACFIEPDHLVVEKIEANLPRLDKKLDGLKIVQLSDFHYVDVRDGGLIRRAVELANGLSPDLVVLTGDYVTASDRHPKLAARNAAPCAEILSDLRAPMGVFGVLGNHDQCDPEFVTHALETRGITMVRNRALSLERSGARFWVAGVDDVLERRARLELALQPILPDDLTILLAHEPDFADEVRKFPVDLQLSGHSHGGQIRLPLVGMPYLPPLAKKYPLGYRRLGSLSLYTNRGLGTTFLPMRFNAPPEVTFITLRSA